MGAVQAARWQRGIGHKRTDVIPPSSSAECLRGIREGSKVSCLNLEKVMTEKKRRPLLFNGGMSSQLLILLPSFYYPMLIAIFL